MAYRWRIDVKHEKKGPESTKVNKSQQKSTEVGNSRRKSAKVDRSRQKSTEVGKSRQKSTFFNGSRSSVHEMQADYQRPTHVLEHKGFGPLRGVFLP